MFHTFIEISKIWVTVGFAVAVGMTIFFVISGIILIAIIQFIKWQSEQEYKSFRNEREKK